MHHLAKRYLKAVTGAFGIMVALLVPAVCLAEGPRPQFDLPVDCQIGKQCFVQNYVDLDPGPGVEDHACGKLAYDGHKGTDIRVRDLMTLKKGITIKAAARGRVVGVRDGMTDRDVRISGPDSVRNVECGNGLVIDHGGGWHSQYCHMRRGSLLVSKGEVVRAGEPLGLMGLSGNTQFPHLHFAVRHEGRIIDPFTGMHQRPSGNCGGQAASGSLWKIGTRSELAYKSSGIIRIGFATRELGISDMEKGLFRDRKGSVTSPVLLFWVLMYGLQPGDKSEFVLRRPDGTVLAGKRNVHEGQHKAQSYTYVGKRRPKSGIWPAGVYTGRYRLSRKMADGSWRGIISAERKFQLGALQ